MTIYVRAKIGSIGTLLNEFINFTYSWNITKGVYQPYIVTELPNREKKKKNIHTKRKDESSPLA